MQRCQENVCLPCRDPDAPCDEITEALINLLMDAMLSQNLLHALDHFCANHKIVPEFTSIPSTAGTRWWHTRLTLPRLKEGAFVTVRKPFLALRTHRAGRFRKWTVSDPSCSTLGP